MSELQLDTSGHFHIMPGHPLHRFMAVNRLEWKNLDAFTQGYIEAAMRDFAAEQIRVMQPIRGNYPVAFSDLAAETLARIMEDCESKQRRVGPPILDADGIDVFWTPERGKAFWTDRQAGECGDHFPPVTIYLGDGGKVRFR
jgi:hypothetical protein